jgi:hypothetical protein
MRTIQPRRDTIAVLRAAIFLASSLFAMTLGLE